MDCRRTRLPAEEPRHRAPVSGHRRTGSDTSRARVSVARVLRSGLPHRVRRVQLSGDRRARWRPAHRHGDRRSARGDQGSDGLHRHIAGARPGFGNAVLHHRQRRMARPRRARPGHQAGSHAPEGRSHRRPRLFAFGWLALGHPSVERTVHNRPDPQAVDDLAAGAHVPVRHGRLRPRRVARRPAARGVVRRDHGTTVGARPVGRSAPPRAM